MSYIVFARKYRPKIFDELIGQSHVTTTLKNAILQDRVAHAYLFSGPRGVGKTTTARILAKALDCEKGPSPQPCNLCPSCNEITQGTSLDTLEIDGASNRGIEEIRNLKENVRFAPSRGRYKIYIIDEVHMLTPEAFNALLKTLEEPPPHVKFIFATTQIHKVPATILSRCQRFDFRRLSTKDIFGNLKKIAEDEKLNISPDALGLIARYADGSMRDGQVILDQIISFTQGKALAEDVTKVLGIIDDELVFGLADSVKAQDSAGVLTMIDRIVNEGKDTLQVVSSLIEHFRNLSILKISRSLDSLIEAGADKLIRYEDQARKFTIEELLYITYTLTNTLELIKKTRLGRVPFEMAMLKLTRLGSVMSLADIIAKIDKLGAKTVGRAEEKGEDPDKTDETKTPGPPPSGKPEAPPTAIDDLLSSWSSVINHIKPKKISIASYLQEGYPMNLEGRTLSIGFPKEFQFHKEVLESPENKRVVEEAIKAVFKIDMKIAFIVVEPVNIPRRADMKGPEKNTDAEDGIEPSAPAKPGEEPMIDAALKIFGGEIARRDKERAK